MSKYTHTDPKPYAAMILYEDGGTQIYEWFYTVDECNTFIKAQRQPAYDEYWQWVVGRYDIEAKQ